MSELSRWVSSELEAPDLPFYAYVVESGPWPTNALSAYIPSGDSTLETNYAIKTKLKDDFISIIAPIGRWGNKSDTAEMLSSLEFILGEGGFPALDFPSRNDIQLVDEPESFLTARNEASLGVLKITEAYIRHVNKKVGASSWKRKSQAVLVIEKNVDDFTGRFIVQWEWEPKFDGE